MVARVYEEAGLTTTGIVLIEEHAQRVKPPRMLAVPFFFGNALGEADNPEYQHKVLRATFDLLDRQQGPVLEQLPENMIPDVLKQGSEVEATEPDELAAAGELVGGKVAGVPVSIMVDATQPTSSGIHRTER